MEAKNVQDALQKAQELLATTQMGLAMLKGHDPRLRPMGIQNVAVFGRSVTLALQNLRTVVGDTFDEWYQAHVTAMKSDPLFAYFRDLRNEVLKEGPPPTSVHMHIKHMNGSDFQRLMANPPPGAKGFFMGDQLGGSGWEVELPDGTTAKFYVQLPPELAVTINLHLPHNPMSDQPISDLCQRYVTELESMVTDAVTYFDRQP